MFLRHPAYLPAYLPPFEGLGTPQGPKRLEGSRLSLEKDLYSKIPSAHLTQNPHHAFLIINENYRKPKPVRKKGGKIMEQLPIVVILGYFVNVERVKQRLISEFGGLITILVPGALEGSPTWVRERGANVIILANDDSAWVGTVLREYMKQGLDSLPTFVITYRPQAFGGLPAKHPNIIFFDGTNNCVVAGFHPGFQLCDRVRETISG